MALLPDKVDRHTTTPFHLKLFYRSGSFHRLEEFNPLHELPPHLQIYTWQTCTLRELSHLLTTALPSLLPSPAIGTRLSFRLIFPDSRSSAQNSSSPARYLTKDLGSIVIGDGGLGILPDDDEAAIVAGGQMAGRLEGDAEKSLQDVKFVIGDYVSCAILPPLANGAVAPPISGRGGFGGGRAMNDFGGRGDFNRGSRENGFGGAFRGRGGRGGFGQGIGSVPSGEWRRGERVPEGPSGRGRGYGGGGGGFGGGGRGRW